MLNTVVLPAPFGPIKPTMEPEPICKERLETAFSPANATVQPRASSRIGALRRPPPAAGAAAG